MDESMYMNKLYMAIMHNNYKGNYMFLFQKKKKTICELPRTAVFRNLQFGMLFIKKKMRMKRESGMLGRNLKGIMETFCYFPSMAF